MRRESIAEQAARNRKRRLAAIKRRAARLTTKKLEALVDAIPAPTHFIVNPRTLAKFKRAQLKSAKLANIKTAATLDGAMASPPPTLYALDDAVGSVPRALESARMAQHLLVRLIFEAARRARDAAKDVAANKDSLREFVPLSPVDLAEDAADLALVMRYVQEAIEHAEDAAKEIARGPFKKEKTDASA